MVKELDHMMGCGHGRVYITCVCVGIIKGVVV